MIYMTSGKTFTDTQDHHLHDLHDLAERRSQIQDHHLHDLHDLAERRSQIPRTIIYMIYMT